MAGFSRASWALEVPCSVHAMTYNICPHLHSSHYPALPLLTSTPPHPTVFPSPPPSLQDSHQPSQISLDKPSPSGDPLQRQTPPSILFRTLPAPCILCCDRPTHALAVFSQATKARLHPEPVRYRLVPCLLGTLSDNAVDDRSHIPRRCFAARSSASACFYCCFPLRE